MKNYLNQIVIFNSKIKGCELEFEPGMKARIVDVRAEIDYFAFNFDTSEFVDHNNELMPCNYYDKNGVPCLTARESGWWPENEIHSNCYLTGDEFELIPNIGEIEYCIQKMLIHGGSFAKKIAEAWMAADSENRNKIEAAFASMILSYEKFSYEKNL